MSFIVDRCSDKRRHTVWRQGSTATSKGPKYLGYNFVLLIWTMLRISYVILKNLYLQWTKCTACATALSCPIHPNATSAMDKFIETQSYDVFLFRWLVHVARLLGVLGDGGWWGGVGFGGGRGRAYGEGIDRCSVVSTFIKINQDSLSFQI